MIAFLRTVYTHWEFLVNRAVRADHMQSLLSAIGISPLRGFIRPTLTANWIRPVMTLKPTLLFQTQAVKPLAVGPMELPTVISLGTSLIPMGSAIPVT